MTVKCIGLVTLFQRRSMLPAATSTALRPARVVKVGQKPTQTHAQAHRSHRRQAFQKRQQKHPLIPIPTRPNPLSQDPPTVLLDDRKTFAQAPLNSSVGSSSPPPAMFLTACSTAAHAGTYRPSSEAPLGRP